MKKSLIGGLMSALLILSGLVALPASAQEEDAPAPTVPEVVQISDPAGDGNFLNDQGFGDLGPGYQGDNAGPENASNTGDILEVWFETTADSLNVNIHTSLPPPGTVNASIYRVHVNPGEGSATGCVWFEGVVAGATWQGDSAANVVDACGDADDVAGEIAVTELDDGTGITTMTFALGSAPGIEAGATVIQPSATSRMIFGASGAGRLTAPQIDNTKPGTDYLIQATATAKPPKKTPPGKNNPPGKKKGCKKGKGKHRGCEGKGKKSPKPGKPVAKCAPVTPAEAAADAPLVTVTDTATAEAPIEQAVTLDQNVSDVTQGDPALAYFNVQVDSAAEKSGLYATFEFPDRRDYDLYMRWEDGSEAASSHGFNPLIEVPTVQNTDSNHAGESTANSENIVGLITPDCGGYTVEVANWLGEGGDFTVKLWLGEGKDEPLAPGEAPASAAAYNAVMALI